MKSEKNKGAALFVLRKGRELGMVVNYYLFIIIILGPGATKESFWSFATPTG